MSFDVVDFLNRLMAESSRPADQGDDRRPVDDRTVVPADDLDKNVVQGDDIDQGDVQAPDIDPESLPPEWRELYEERAAILEYDGQMPRERAEAVALTETLARMHAAPADDTDQGDIDAPHTLAGAGRLFDAIPPGSKPMPAALVKEWLCDERGLSVTEWLQERKRGQR